MKTTKAKKFQTPHEAKPAAKANADKVKPTKSAKAPRKGKLGELLGYSVVSVIRAMGKNGWDFETAKAALGKAGIEAAQHTLKVGLKRGRDGQKKIAPLSAKELDTLRVAPAKAKANAKKSAKGEVQNALAA